MLHVLNQTNIKSFSKVRSEFPYRRILMQIASLDDSEGRLVAVSDSADSDNALCEKLHENLERYFMCHNRKLCAGRRKACCLQCEMMEFIR